MKKKFVFIAALSFLFFSCVVEPEKTPENNDENNNTKPNPGDKNELGTITFENLSDYDVNVYFGVNPYVGSTLCTVPASSASFSKQVRVSPDQSIGDVFYFEYLIKIGNSVFPYWTKEATSGWKTVAVKKDNSSKITIEKLLKCESKSAYLLIENNTKSTVRLNNGNSPLTPHGSNEALIPAQGGCGIYVLSSPFEDKPADITLNFLDLVKIKVDVTYEIPLPVTNSDVKAGNIYTISVNTDEKGVTSASLKAVTPFNIDTQKKIWSADNSMFKTQRSDGSEKKHSIPVCMRPSSDGKSTLVMGTNTRSFTIGNGDNVKRITTDLPGIIRVNEYGEYPKDGDFRTFFFNTNEAETLKRIEVIDFVEQNDGYIVMLLKRCFEDDFYDDYLIICYNFNAQDNQESIKWYKVISPVENPQEYKELVFRKDTKNRLVRVGEDEYICVGACSYYEADSEEYVLQNRRYMLFYANGKLIGKNKNTDDGFKMILSDDGSAAGTERILSSAYFDGSDLYVCGYENWEPSGYTGTHTGKIWKSSISEIKNGNFDFANCEYSKNYCLFFSIDGTGSDFGVCGEYYAKDDGGSLKGCYVTSRMLKENSSCEPKLYSIKDKSYCWFNQLCQYENKIVLCGKADMTMDGSNNPLPFVVAYDYDGNKLWENLSFTEYTDALNIIPNTIGTYMLQLEGKNGIIHYVNADLLGNEKK